MARKLTQAAVQIRNTFNALAMGEHLTLQDFRDAGATKSDLLSIYSNLRDMVNKRIGGLEKAGKLEASYAYTHVGSPTFADKKTGQIKAGFEALTKEATEAHLMTEIIKLSEYGKMHSGSLAGMKAVEKRRKQAVTYAGFKGVTDLKKFGEFMEYLRMVAGNILYDSGSSDVRRLWDNYRRGKITMQEVGDQVIGASQVGEQFKRYLKKIEDNTSLQNKIRDLVISKQKARNAKRRKRT